MYNVTQNWLEPSTVVLDIQRSLAGINSLSVENKALEDTNNFVSFTDALLSQIFFVYAMPTFFGFKVSNHILIQCSNS